MSSDIHQRLMEAAERVRSARKLHVMLAEAQRILRDETEKNERLREQFASEESDVKKLEGLSLTHIFYSVLGTKDTKLRTEKQELLAAQLKYDESLGTVEEMQEEVERLREQLVPFVQVDAEYDRLIREKDQFLRDANDDKAEKLSELSERLADLNADGKELAEAIEAGEAAMTSLEKVRSDLRSASNWGTLDMFGGGLLSTMAKHSKIDSAKQHAHRTQQRLRRFQEELVDAGQRLHVSLEIGEFSKFADYFFDNLITDWLAQSKIKTASSSCATTASKVTGAVDECRRRLEETQRDISSVGKSRLEFIEQA